MRGFTRDKILFLSSLMAILALIGASMFSAGLEAKAGDVGSDTLVVSAVVCENGNKLSLTIDENVTKNDLQIDEKYIQLKDSSGAIVPLDLENANVSTESAIIIYFKEKIDIGRLENSTLSLKKGFKVSENGKSLSCDVDWEVYEFEEDIGNVIYKAKIDFKQGNASELTLYVGETMALNDICNPDPKCIGGKWSSKSSKIATVKNDVLTAVGVGTTDVRLTFKDGDEYFITVVVKESSNHQSESIESPKESSASESKSESLFESDSDFRYGESENISESCPDGEGISESESLSESESESESEPESKVGSESESMSESESDFESVSESQSEYESGSESESKSEYESEFDSESENESESETVSENDSGRESVSETETASDRESETEITSDRESKEDSGKESESGNSGDTSLNSSKTDSRKIIFPLICIGVLIVIGILLIPKKGDPHA